MEDSAGLGNHIRHDALTGAAQLLKENNSFKESGYHATVFVSAVKAEKDTDGTDLMQNEEYQPSFPMHPPHPSQIHSHAQHQALSPPAIKAIFPTFPPPPPHPTNMQSIAPSFGLQMQLNFPPPPTVPPQFPPPPGIPPNFGPLPTPTISNSGVSPQPDVPIPSTNSIQQREVHLLAQNNAMSSSNTTMQTSPFKEDPSQTDIQYEESNDPIERARAIARRFHVESTQRRTLDNNSIIPDNSIPSGINYLEKRQAHFLKERNKLDKFRLKNLEYVIKHDERELRHHVDCMNQITAFEEKQSIQLELAKQQQIQRQMKLEQRQQLKTQTSMMNASGGGIGSKDQQNAERVRKREHLEQGTSNVTKKSNHESSRVATQRNSLYLTNLPTDGSTTERMLHSLFSSYGRLDRVTMYRHRSTGELKGDGLIVFGRDALDAYNKTGDNGDLVDAVCLQVSVMTSYVHFQQVPDQTLYVELR
jgi:hypothetical protein